MEIIIYTDGAAKGNPGPGGFGAVLMAGKFYKEISQGFSHTTNNRMELLAVICALELLKNDNMSVTIYSDSKYVVDAVEKNWIYGWVKRGWKNVKNPDLWKRYMAVAAKHKVKFIWVKGHAGNLHNERCDVLAVEASNGRNLPPDTGYNPE